jgi:integrase
MKARTKIRRKQTKTGTRWYVALVHPDGSEDAHGGFRTRGEARDKAAEVLGDAKRNRYVQPDHLTVSAYLLGEWLPSRETANVSVNTRDVEAMIVSAWILPHIGDVPLQELTPRDIDGLYRTLRRRGGRGGKPLRGKSVRNAHGVLSRALKDAVRRGLLAVDPTAAVDPPAKDDSVERTAWTRDEVHRFLEVASRDRLAAIWRLAVATGARRGELLGIQWSDLDLETGAMTIARQVLVRPGAVHGEPRVYIRETTKTRRVRRVRFDAATAAALRRWKVAQDEERLAFGPAWKTHGGLGVEAAWVVTESDGAVVHPDTFGARFAALVKVAGVTAITLHAARHTYAELALGAGVRLDVVSRQLGHASISTTSDIYLHDSGEAAADAAVKLAEVLDG